MNADALHAIRRILVALDSSRASLAALDAAVDLAGRIDAELLGIFVEDVELLRMADAPYAREILYPSAMEAPLSRGTMERNFKAQSAQARTGSRARRAESAPAMVVSNRSGGGYRRTDGCGRRNRPSRNGQIGLVYGHATPHRLVCTGTRGQLDFRATAARIRGACQTALARLL